MMKYLEMNIKSKTRYTVSVFRLYTLCFGTALFAASLPSRCRIFNIFYTVQKKGGGTM